MQIYWDTVHTLRGAQLVYDMVNARGELVQRVRLPAGRTIAGFGGNGNVYLLARDGANGLFIERTRLAAGRRCRTRRLGEGRDRLRAGSEHWPRVSRRVRSGGSSMRPPSMKPLTATLVTFGLAMPASTPAAAQDQPRPPAQAQAQAPADAKPVSINMEDVPYPHAVRFLEFSIYDEDVRLAYMDVPPLGQPNGRTVVLLHGMNFFGEYWAGPIDVLRKEGFRVVVPDQIGFGRSSKAVIPYNFHDMARNTKRLLDQLQITKAAIVGHSMGGMLAARFATQYPDVAERVVIYNPIGLTDTRYDRPWTDTEENYRRVLAQNYQSASAGIRRYFAHDPNGWKPEYEKYVRIHYGWTLSGEWPRFAMVRARIQQMTYLDPVVHDWARIKSPTLAIGSQEDGANFAERMRFIAQTVPNGNGRLHLIPGVGHVPHFEAPEKLYPPLVAFLKDGLPKE